MRAIVTGGAGFIGSHLVDALVNAGAAVLAIDNLSAGKEGNLNQALARGANLARIDIRNGAALQTAFGRFRPDFVFHLAAQVNVRHSMADPSDDAHTNVVGSVNVLSASAANGARRVINTSTGGAIYGDGAPIPTPESAPSLPLSSYGLSKSTAERYADWFCRTRGLDVVTLRYGNVYGPRQDPAGDAGVIAIFCSHALGGLQPIVFGDGNQTRDYVFVTDIVAANLAAVHADGLQHSTFNVGSGREVSVLDLVSAVASAAGLHRSSFRPQIAPARLGEVFRSCLDVSRAREELHLKRPTPLEHGLRETLEWMRQSGSSIGS